MQVGTFSGEVTRPGEVTVYLDPAPITHEELNMSQDDVAELLGDGAAEVIVSHEQSDKDFGNGTRTFVSVKLRVNQDTVSIERGLELANFLALGYIPAARDAARGVWDEMTRPAAAPEANRGRRG